MKKVLSLLLAFILLQTQSWALSGGPVFSGGQFESFIGTYAGVLVPEIVIGQIPVPAGTPVPGTTATATTSSAAIGLFSFAQPSVGPATGALLLFVNGTAFNGTMTGLIDPEDGSFRAVIDAQSTFVITIFVPQTTTTGGATTTTFVPNTFPIFAQGSIEAEVRFESVDVSATVATTTASPARIAGIASLDIFFQVANNGTPIITTVSRFEVDGFKQSDDASGGAQFNFGQNFSQGGVP